MTDHDMKIGSLEARVERLIRDVAEQDAKLDEIIAMMEQAKGAKWLIGLTAGLLSFGSTLAATAAGLFRAH